MYVLSTDGRRVDFLSLAEGVHEDGGLRLIPVHLRTPHPILLREKNRKVLADTNPRVYHIDVLHEPPLTVTVVENVVENHPEPILRSDDNL